MLHIVLKGNTERHVQEDQLATYIADGWVEVDKTGRHIPKAKTNAFDDLAKENQALQRENEAFKDELERLRSDFEELKARAKRKPKADEKE